MTDPRPLDSWEHRAVAEWARDWGVPRLHVFRCVGSTSDVARALAESGAPAGTAVIADAQTAGRGRAGRRWHAPHGAGLLLSIVLRPATPPAAEAPLGTVPLRVGLGVIRGIENACEIRLGLEWPNDVLAPDRAKLAGILCEGAPAVGGYIIAGIGVNVHQSPGDFPDDLGRSATSLRIATGTKVSRAALARTIIHEVLAHAGRAVAPLEPAELAELAVRDTLAGRLVTVDGRPRGVAAGFAADGALLVRDAAGRIHALHSGTVRALENTLDHGQAQP